MASVPELTSRTFSIDGTADDQLGQFVLGFGRRHSWCRRRPIMPLSRPDAHAENHRPPGTDVVDVAVAVDVVKYAPSARSMNSGSPPTAPNARAGLLTPPGISTAGSGECRPTAGPVLGRRIVTGRRF